KATTPKAKQVIIDEFRTNREIQVFLSTDAGQDSIDLPEASLTIHYNLPWTDATLTQRRNRQDRIDSEQESLEDVTLQYDNTVENRKEEIIKVKRGYHERVFGGKAASDLDSVGLGDYLYVLTGRTDDATV